MSAGTSENFFRIPFDFPYAILKSPCYLAIWSTSLYTLNSVSEAQEKLWYMTKTYSTKVNA